MCLSKRLFSAVIQNPVKESHRLFVEGTTAVLTSGFTGWSEQSLVEPEADPLDVHLLITDKYGIMTLLFTLQQASVQYLPGLLSIEPSCCCSVSSRPAAVVTHFLSPLLLQPAPRWPSTAAALVPSCYPPARVTWLQTSIHCVRLIYRCSSRSEHWVLDTATSTRYCNISLATQTIILHFCTQSNRTTQKSGLNIFWNHLHSEISDWKITLDWKSQFCFIYITWDHILSIFRPWMWVRKNFLTFTGGNSK